MLYLIFALNPKAAHF